MELKSILISLVRNFEMHCEQAIEEIRPLYTMVMRPERPILVRFTKRN